jgi:hypothetical protein
MKQAGLLRNAAWFENTQIPCKFIRILKEKTKVQNAYAVLVNGTHRWQFKKYTPVHEKLVYDSLQLNVLQPYRFSVKRRNVLQAIQKSVHTSE